MCIIPYNLNCFYNLKSEWVKTYRVNSFNPMKRKWKIEEKVENSLWETNFHYIHKLWSFCRNLQTHMTNISLIYWFLAATTGRLHKLQFNNNSFINYQYTWPRVHKTILQSKIDFNWHWFSFLPINYNGNPCSMTSKIEFPLQKMFYEHGAWSAPL